MLNRFSEWIYTVMHFERIHAWFVGILPLILWELIKLKNSDKTCRYSLEVQLL